MVYDIVLPTNGKTLTQVEVKLVYPSLMMLESSYKRWHPTVDASRRFLHTHLFPAPSPKPQHTMDIRGPYHIDGAVFDL